MVLRKDLDTQSCLDVKGKGTGTRAGCGRRGEAGTGAGRSA